MVGEFRLLRYSGCFSDRGRPVNNRAGWPRRTADLGRFFGLKAEGEFTESNPQIVQ